MENFNKKPEKDSLIITGLEIAKPNSTIGNSELEEDLKDTYKYLQGNHGKTDPIFEKVGIKNRHSVMNSMTATDLSVEAGKKLMEKYPLNNEDKMLVITGTMSAEDRLPSSAAKTLERLNLTRENGYNKITAFDVSAACSGWTYGIEIAEAMLISKGYMSAIVFSSDTMTRLVDKKDKSRVLWGDAATASLIEREKEGSKGFRILKTDTVTYAVDTRNIRYPTELSLDSTPEEKNKMNLKGGEVYKSGVEYSAEFIKKYLKENNIDIKDIDYVIPHQSNKSMLDSLNEVLNLGKNKYGEEKMLINIENVGNTGASSAPLCLFDFKEKGMFKNGDKILMCSFGAGYTIGIVEVEFID